jgi:hypothetical protein
MVDETSTPSAAEVPGANDGKGGPNVTPAFGNRPQTDNNRPIEESSEQESFEEGAKVASDSNVAGFQVSDDVLATANAGEEQEGFKQYASPSIPRLRIGNYEFENGVLRVPDEEVEKFEKILNASSSLVKQAVSTIDREGGEAVARKFLDSQGKMTRGPTTSDSAPPAANPLDRNNQA